MNIESIENEFKQIMSSDNASYFNIVERNFSPANKEEYIYENFKKYRRYSERKGAELLFGSKKYKGVEHIILNIDKEKFFKEGNISWLELYKRGIIFTEGEFFVF